MQKITALVSRLLFLLAPTMALASPLPGAIFTTTKDGQTVNANHYPNREAVYLNGGPQNNNSAGLPDGTYYFQVTDPSGRELLSTDLAEKRKLRVQNGRVFGVPNGDGMHAVGDLNSANTSLPVQLFPFNYTPNEGGEYKAWLIREASVRPDGVRLVAADGSGNGPEALSNADCKTDNFKITRPDTPPATYTVSGTVFFDANYSGTRNADEPGLGGAQVTLADAAGATVATTSSSAAGTYSFSGIISGSYSVIVSTNIPALSPTTMVDHDLTVTNANATAPDTGFALSFNSLNGMAANGFTIGYWKTNLSKALAGQTKGVQVSAATLSNYTSVIGSLALSPFAGLSMTTAVDTLSATGSAPTVLLAKQLLGSEYNFANKAYLGGSEALTYLFIYQGEYVLKNYTQYSSAYVLWLKDWFDAYNNTHGGAIAGPAAF